MMQLGQSSHRTAAWTSPTKSARCANLRPWLPVPYFRFTSSYSVATPTDNSMRDLMTRIFSEGRAKDYLEREIKFLDDLRLFLEQLGRSDQAENVEGLLRGLQDPFTIVVVGEYNTGKSSFVNALLGQELLEQGVVPTTDRITLVRHAEDDRQPEGKRHRVVQTQSEALRDLHIIDTPGTNSIILEHRDTTEGFIHRAELILFVISAVQPFSESERGFLDFIRGRWDRKVVFLLNKIDLLSAQDLPLVRQYVEKNAYKLMDFEPLLFEMSARQGLEAKLDPGSDDTKLEASGLAAIERYIFDTLSSKEKIHLKLRSPLKAAEHICSSEAEALAIQIRSLRLDEDKIEQLLSQLAERKEELMEFFSKYRAEIDRIFAELRARVHRFIQEKLTTTEIARMRLFRRSLEDEFKEQFLSERGPLSGLTSIIDESIDFVSRNNKKLWDFALNYIRERIVEAESYGTNWETDFDKSRRQVLEAAHQAADRFQNFDVETEALEIRNAAQAGLKNFLVLQGVAVTSALGLTALLTTPLLDFTGIAFATAIGVMGFFVLPRKRQQAINEFDLRINALNEGFKDNLNRQLEKAVAQVTDEIRENVSPLLGLCRQQRKQAQERRERLVDMASQLQLLETDLERDYGGASDR